MSAAVANARFQLEPVESVTFDGFQDFRGREFPFHGTQITKVGGKGGMERIIVKVWTRCR